MDMRPVSRTEQLADKWQGRAIAWLLITLGLGIYSTFVEPWADVWARWLS